MTFCSMLRPRAVFEGGGKIKIILGPRTYIQEESVEFFQVSRTFSECDVIRRMGGGGGALRKFSN